MNQAQANRLATLIEFLQQLKRDQFDFSIVRHEAEGCGTVACAIGWTPTLFPRLVHQELCDDSGDGMRSYDVQPRGEPGNSVTEALFGLDWDCFIPRQGLFDLDEEGNNTKSIVRAPGRHATAKQVAKYLIKVLNHSGYDYV